MAAPAQSALQRRPLMHGMPPYSQALQAQLSNLHTFLADHKEEFDRMRYMPWTQVPTGTHSFAKPAVVRRSDHLPGLMGTFLLEPLHVKRSALSFKHRHARHGLLVGQSSDCLLCT